MKLAAGLLSRCNPTLQHARFNLSKQPFVTPSPSRNITKHSLVIRRLEGSSKWNTIGSFSPPKSQTEASSEWSTISNDEMGTRLAKKRSLKTWASTHHSKPGPDQRGAVSSSRGRSRYSTFTWGTTADAAEKEAKLQELERGLDVYSHTTPAGPPHIAGSSFLNPLSKPSSSSLTLDHPFLASASSCASRLKTPSMAYTADPDEANDLLSCLGPGPLGLDIEWNVSYNGSAQRTALLQICSPSLVLVLHLSSMGTQLPPLLKSILEDPTIIKTGVAIKNDALKLQRDFQIHTRNALELSNLAKLAQPERWKDRKYLISLRDLTRTYLGRRLRKDAVRISNWEKYPLTKEQIEYAASDTFVSLEVLRAISEYFKAAEGEGEGLLGKLDRLNAKDVGPMELEKALRLSAYDLWQERMELGAAEKHKRTLRTALRSLQAPPQERATSPKAPSPSKPKRPAATSAGSSDSDNDDSITVTRVLLAYERATHTWLYSRQTIDQVASSSKIKPSTVANYILKSLLAAKAADRENGQSGILEDFTREHRLRLDAELKSYHFINYKKRFRTLAKSLGWMEVVQSMSGSDLSGSGSDLSGSGSGSGNESESESGKKVVKRAPPTKWSDRPIEIEDSDEEMDVVDDSR